MGGFGSGRYGRRSNRYLDIDCVRVSMTDLVKAGILASLPSRLSSPSMPLEVELNGGDDTPLAARLSVGTSTGNTPWSFPRTGDHIPPSLWVSIDSLFVQLTRTRQNFGGSRLWFVCPRRTCGRRCSVLYRPRQLKARAFACRNCYAIRYRSQRIAPAYRLENRADRILAPLLGDGDLPRRPKGMHRATFQARMRQAEAFLERSQWLLRFRPFGI